MASEPLGSGFQTLGDEGNGLIIKSFSPSFLPVQDSSIGDLVTQSVTDVTFDYNHYNHYNHYSETSVTRQ